MADWIIKYPCVAEMLQRADECLEYQVDGAMGHIGDTSTYVPLIPPGVRLGGMSFGLEATGEGSEDAALSDAEQCVAWRRGLWDLPEDCFMR